jgi:uncharacterized protein involved in outer membrane biogenesis
MSESQAARPRSRTRFAKRALLAIAFFAALGGAVEWAVEQLSVERHRGLIERELSKAFGRSVRLGGELHLEILPSVRFEAHDVSVESEPGRASPLLQIDTLRLALALGPLLARRFEVEALGIEGARLRLETDAEGNLDVLPNLGTLSGEGAASGSGFQVRLRRLELREVQVAYQDVPRGSLTTLHIEALALAAGPGDDPLEWNAQGQLGGAAFALIGSAGSLEALLHPSEPWPVAIRGSLSDAELAVSGRIARPLELAGLDLDVAVELPDFARLYEQEYPRLPRLGAARVKGHLVDPDGVHGLEGISLETEESAGLRLRVTGRIARLAEPGGVELKAQLEADRLGFLTPLLERPLPPGSLSAQLRISDGDGTLGVDGEVHAKSDDGSLALDATGGFADLRAREGLDARVAIVAPGLDVLAKAAALERKLPALGPVRGSARLRRERGALGLSELKLDVGRKQATWLHVEGRLEDLEKWRGVGLDATFGARSLAELGRVLGRTPAWPDAGPLNGMARVRDPGGRLGIERFELSGGEPGVLAVQVNGGIRDLRQIDALSVQAKVDARDLAVIGVLFGAELPLRGPVRFEGRVEGSNEQIASQGVATVGGTRVEGTWSGSFPVGGRPRVDAQLRAALVRLEDLWLGPDPVAGEASAPVRPAPWRDTGALPFDRLRTFDTKLSVQAERVTGGKAIDARNAHLRLALENGRLDVREFGVDYQGGRVAGGLSVDGQSALPSVGLRLDATALDLASVDAALELGGGAGAGEMDFALDLRAQGHSPDALLAGLEGRAALALRNWTASSSYASRFLLSLRRAFLAGSLAKPDPVGCLLGALAFQSGVGRVQTLVLDGAKARIDGTGHLDFKRDVWDLRLVPTLRDPGLLTLAGAVVVKGPLDAPRFEPLPLDIASGALQGVVRGALSPAKAVTTGAKSMLGPVGRLFDPLDGALDLAGGQTSRPRLVCALPRGPQGTTTSSTESSPGTPSRSGKP